MFKEKLKKQRVHVGCGPHNIKKDWWNVDSIAFPGVDDVLDVTKKWDFNNLEYIYAEHFLEHLEFDDALAFLCKAGNSLKQGGIMRLSMPNLSWVLKTHFDTGKNVGDKKRAIDTIVINRAFHGWQHKFLYTKELLKEILSEAGFEDITFHLYGESNIAELKNLENHGDFSVCDGEPSVIIVEAKKGSRNIKIPSSLYDFLYEQFISHVKFGH